MIKAVIFDFDGLILDTETQEGEILSALYAEHDVPFPRAEWLAAVGTHNDFDPFARLAHAANGFLDATNLRHTYRQRMFKRLQNESARPGVTDYLVTAKELGLGIGLASSSAKSWVHPYLKQLGIFNFFSCIFTEDDVEFVKPDPALYQKAIECLDVAPHEAIAFEDSPNGSLAAVRAGLHCVVVMNSVTENLSFAPVDLTLRSMTDLSLNEILEKWS